MAAPAVANQKILVRQSISTLRWPITTTKCFSRSSGPRSWKSLWTPFASGKGRLRIQFVSCSKAPELVPPTAQRQWVWSPLQTSHPAWALFVKVSSLVVTLAAADSTYHSSRWRMETPLRFTKNRSGDPFKSNEADYGGKIWQEQEDGGAHEEL